MIVYGSRMYFKRNLVKSSGECEHCGVYGAQVSYQARKFGHLYFIPLLPLASKSQVLSECKSCGAGVHIPIASIEPMVESLKDRFKSLITDVQDDKTEIVPGEGTEPVNIGVLIAGILEDLYRLNEIEDMSSVSEILKASNMAFENAIVSGRWSEVKGDPVQARLHYDAAHRIKPESPIPLFQMGTLDVRRGDTPAAEEAFGKYLALCPGDIAAYIELASLYESQKDHSKIVETYDRIYALDANLIPQKGMKKIYKKACKKSGIPGKFLDKM